MTTVENLPSATTERPIGFGRLKRKEDARFIRGKGQLPRRHPAAGDGLRRDAAQPVRARAHPLDRHLEGARAPQRRGRRHRQGPRDARARVDADDLLRHPGRARGRQGPVPGPGGRVRDRDGRVLGERRARADRRRVRAAAGDRQRPQGARPRRAADPRRQGRPARQPREPDLGGRRRGGDGPRVRGGRHDRDARHHLSALPSCAARDVRHDRRLQPGDRPARHLQRQPGAARAPHGLRARRRARRAHDPDHLLRHRRRVRQQGSGVSRATCARSPARSWPASRSSGSRTAPRTCVDRVRARLRHARGDVLEGRQDHRPARRRDRRPRRVRLAPRSRRSSRPGSSTSSAGRTTSRRRTSRSRPSTRTRRREASRTAARSASPRPSTSWSAWSTRSRSR